MNTPRNPLLRTAAAASAIALLALFASTTARAQAVAPVKPADETAAAKDKDKDIVELSPFTVKSDKDTGYFAENTLAGSRLNTNLADLASSITVVTKQQMEDTASLDINDVFKYEASTEGSNTYTPFVTDGRGVAKDTNAGYMDSSGAVTTNAQSNRIRGIAPPDAGMNNYPTNNRVPFDAYNVQSIEITRGPNSLLFGLGTPAGIVNQTVAQAALNKNTNEVSLRTDQNGSYRSSLSVNRSLIKDKLSVYGAFLYNNQQFERKPSRDLTRREFAAITYKPFKNTVIRAFAENYENDANRPNSMTPRDLVTPWLNAGRPAYDPTTRTITVLDTGKTYGPYVSSANSPGAVAGNIFGAGAPSTLFLTTTPPNTVPNPQFVPGIQFDDTSRPVRMIDGTTNWLFQRNPVVAGVNYPTAQTNPATATVALTALWPTAGDPRYLIADRQWSDSTIVYPFKTVNGTNYTFLNGVAYGSYQNPTVNNKKIYDWTKYNHARTNFAHSRASNYNLEFEQQILPNLFFSAGWLRQDIDEADNYTMSQLTGATLQVDTNTKNIDGTPNKYFGLPFVSEGVGGGLDNFYTPQTDDNVRAMLAYDLDLSKQSSVLRFLGRHRLLSLWSAQDSNRAQERWRMNYVSGDADATLRQVANLNIPGTAQWSGSPGSSATMRKYYMASPGDPQATVTHSVGFWGNQGWNQPVTSQIQVYNYTTGQFQNDTITEQALFAQTGSFRTQRLVRSWTFAAQSYFWDDRLVTTLGWRHDAYRSRITSPGALTDVNGVVYAPTMTNAQLFTNGVSGLINHDAVMSRWWRWDALSGNTKTLGGALRPLRGSSLVKQIGGGDSILSEFLEGMTLYYNQSDNFNPPLTFQTDYFKKALPKPTGKGKDVGLGFNIIKNKLVARINWYTTDTQSERTNSATTLLGRLAYSDTTTGIPWASAVQRIRNGANTAIANWNTEAANPVGDPVNQQKIYDLLKLPLNYYSGAVVGGTQNSHAKGAELQLTYNPTPNWTIKWSGDKQKTSYTNVVPQYDSWLAVRLPVWQSIGAPEIADFTDGGGVRYSLKNFWSGYGFTNVALITDPTNTSPSAYFANVVSSIVATAKALQGVTAPDQRQYHSSILTNYRISEGKFKGVSFGGSERWESRAAIGFLGKVNDPVNVPGVVNFSDPTKPVYDHGNYYTDLWVAYGRKIFHDKIGWKLQLNINNAMESGRLMPTAVNFDGVPWAYRIIDPRQFVLTSTFMF